MNQKKKHNTIWRFAIPITVIAILLALKLIETGYEISFSEYGILPRHISGLKGLFFTQFIHGDWMHVFYNIFPFLISYFIIFHLYPESAKESFLISFFVPGIFVWAFARGFSYHIGLSGVNYSLLTFILTSGLLRRDARTLALSMLVIFLYGGLIPGLFPIKEGVSFESHIAGAVTGVVLAVIFRNRDLPKKYEWLDEPEDEFEPPSEPY